MPDQGEGPRRARSRAAFQPAAADLPLRCGRPCEDFALRAGPYPFPLGTPAHGWPARPKETRYVVAAPQRCGVLGTCDCVRPPKWRF
jgi:hypothetical protein